MQIPLSDVPIEARRIAAQHLESLRGTELIQGMDDARLGDQVVPIHRPDLKDVAYYEFSVVGGDPGRTRLVLTRGYEVLEAAAVKKAVLSADKETKAGSKEAGAAARVIGFIVVSNGRHDFPVAHWSMDRQPPSRQVLTKPGCDCDEEEATGGKPARLYKLDALSYAAEDSKGALVGQTGQLPPLVRGLPHSLARFAGNIASAEANPVRSAESDKDASDATHDVKTSKDDRPELKFEDEGGWKALKSRYADAFGPFLDHLKARAARLWEIEDLVEEFGEGIVTGTAHRVALLGEAAVEIRGDGARLVEPSIEENPAGPPSLVLRARPAAVKQESGFEVALRYRGGEKETLRFFVVSRDVPSNSRAARTGKGCNCEGEG